MEMTIDEHKEHLLDIMDAMPDDACGDWRDSLAYAIEVMRKYSMIEQILKDIPYGGEATVRRIQEVVRNEISESNK